MATAKRYSKQRFTILHELQQVTTHPTADEIFALTKKTIPNISLGTVYRNLNELSEQGAVLKFTINGKEHFDGNINPHIHLCCEKCGEILDVFDKFGDISVKLVQNDSFKVNNIILSGCCEKCY